MEKELKEESQISASRRPFQYAALALIILDFLYEAYMTFAEYRFSVLGWGYGFLFLALWFWRCGFQYTCTLTDRAFTVVTVMAFSGWNGVSPSSGGHGELQQSL